MNQTTPRLYKRETFNSESQWLNARAFGGSSASAIVGKNPWMSKLDLYNAIVNGRKRDEETKNDSMLYGTECEKYIRSIVRENCKGRIRVLSPRQHEMFRRVDKPYMTATLDGRLIVTTKMDGDTVLGSLEPGSKGVLEIKTHDVRNRLDESNWNDSHIPDNYFIQVCHYLAVMNDFDFAILVAKLRYFDYFEKGGKSIRKEEIRYYRMVRSDPVITKNIAYIERMETQFWEENIQKRMMPEITIG
ncbi:MAG: YqaJ viral recombinase family protein [Bacilli bacterium]|jgi:putative phage-type endonuclease|nr:YqaJ viral recombinase family protein [Bacilli bacterium]